MKNTLSYFIRRSEGKGPLDRTSVGERKILTIGSFDIREEILALEKKVGNFIISRASIG